jgi:hypothetical protein
MLYLMVYSAHYDLELPMIAASSMTGLWVGLALILVIEMNALFGKMNPMIASVKAVIHSGLALTIIFAILVQYF